jgi:hypothetical protein
MINLNFTVRNPWSQQFKNLWGKSYSTPFKYKFVEFQIYRDSSLLQFVIDWTMRQSHSGLKFELGLLGYCVDFNLYDSRHWDYKKNCYHNYSNEEGLC